MSLVASRDLRNHTRDVLGRVAAGETLTITVGGRPVAQLVPPGDSRPTHFTKDEFARLFAPAKTSQHDPALLADLTWISDGTTDDLGPIR